MCPQFTPRQLQKLWLWNRHNITRKHILLENKQRSWGDHKRELSRQLRWCRCRVTRAVVSAALRPSLARSGYCSPRLWPSCRYNRLGMSHRLVHDQTCYRCISFSPRQLPAVLCVSFIFLRANESLYCNVFSNASLWQCHTCTASARLIVVFTIIGAHLWYSAQKHCYLSGNISGLE